MTGVSFFSHYARIWGHLLEITGALVHLEVWVCMLRNILGQHLSQGESKTCRQLDHNQQRRSRSLVELTALNCPSGPNHTQTLSIACNNMPLLGKCPSLPAPVRFATKLRRKKELKNLRQRSALGYFRKS